MKHLLVISLALTIASAPTAAGITADFDHLDDFIEEVHVATGHPFGTAVAVVKDGEVLYEGYFGFSDIGQETPVTRDTVFYIASATKPFVALNALLLEHEGRLDTRMSLQRMFPDAAFAGLGAKEIDIRDLLVHTSSIENPGMVWATAYSGLHDDVSRRRLVAHSHASDIPHGTFNYSNVGYNILSVWMDGNVGMPWQEQLDEQIFGPLGMERTSARVSEAEGSRWPLAKPYSFASESPRDPLYLTKADNTMQAAGGILSTAPDLAKFLLAQMPVDSGSAGATLPASVLERSHEVQVHLEDSFLDFQRSGYAWGWYAGDYKNRSMLHHFGGFAGFHAHLSFMPEEGVGLVVLNNDDFLGARVTSLIADYVYGALLGQQGNVPEMAQRFEELRVDALKFRAWARDHRDEIQGREWHLSLPHSAYAGLYRNDLLGEMSISVSNNSTMQVEWGRLSAVATGLPESDNVRVELVPNSGTAMSFRVGGRRVQAVVLEGMEFRRVH